ncbi:hypothetical protein ACLHZ0_21935 [Aeromonas salmonicida]|uniref:hypothetical protein n=1 Tax=Aeromonas salmonicida TaxID=645 RepID=UPI003D04E679
MAVKQGEYTIELYRGDSSIIEMTFSDINNDTGVETLTNLSNILVTSQVRYDDNNPDVWLNLNPVIADATKGLIRITISATTSANAARPTDPLAPLTGVWDLQFQDKANAEIVFTPLRGTFRIIKDVTRKA